MPSDRRWRAPASPGLWIIPTLDLVDANGALVRANDNWGDTQSGEIIATKIQPPDDWESAVVATLPAGSYTAIVGGKDAATGVGLFELYNLGE